MKQDNIPIGIQFFERMREKNDLYIDKTQSIWNLINNGKFYYFARPRRFGRSLLLSIMKAYFEGRQDLFEGLAIEQYEKDWIAYPVLFFTLQDYTTQVYQESTLTRYLRKYENKYDIQSPQTISLKYRLSCFIQALYEKTGRQAVVLVDNDTFPDVLYESKEYSICIYRQFFSALKENEQYIRFAFFTGRTEYIKTAMGISDWVKDITFMDEYAALCGITEEEFETCFHDEISKLAEQEGQTYEECLERLKNLYGGWRFTPGGPVVYNPLSIAKALHYQEYEYYWYTYSPLAFLSRQFIQSNFTVTDFLTALHADEKELTKSQIYTPDSLSVFFQLGYLTITGKDDDGYRLQIPNEEVRNMFLHAISPSVLGHTVSGGSWKTDAWDALSEGNIEGFIKKLSYAFDHISNQRKEKYHSYHDEWKDELCLLLMYFMPYYETRIWPDDDVIRSTIIIHKNTYLFAFTLDKSADQTLNYPENKKSGLNKTIRIGVNFSSRKRNIENWKIL